MKFTLMLLGPGMAPPATHTFKRRFIFGRPAIGHDWTDILAGDPDFELPPIMVAPPVNDNRGF